MNGIRWAPGILSVLPHLRYQIEHDMRLQEVATRLAILTPKGADVEVKVERLHRQRLGMREVDAYESVAADIIAGRWLPEAGKPIT